MVHASDEDDGSIARCRISSIQQVGHVIDFTNNTYSPAVGTTPTSLDFSGGISVVRIGYEGKFDVLYGTKDKPQSHKADVNVTSNYVPDVKRLVINITYLAPPSWDPDRKSGERWHKRTDVLTFDWRLQKPRVYLYSMEEIEAGSKSSLLHWLVSGDCEKLGDPLGDVDE
jgi:hypothetical protein